MFQTEHLQEKWQPVLDHPDLPKIEDSYRRAVTTVILENQSILKHQLTTFLHILQDQNMFLIKSKMILLE